MTSNDKAAVLRRISNASILALSALGQERSCITASAVLAKVLKQSGFAGTYTLKVDVDIHNAETLRWVEQNGAPANDADWAAAEAAGAASAVIGSQADESEDKWPGHLVVIVPEVFHGEPALIDLTLEQANKPEWGIRLRPVLAEVDQAFIVRGESFDTEVNGCRVTYYPFPSDHSYTACDAWTTPAVDLMASAAMKRLTVNP